jgi:hypothetical protein
LSRDPEQTLGLHVGDWVEVRSASEIMETLDASGSLDELPFMPEMIKWCGRRVKVFRRADKTCDTIRHTGIRRMRDAVHLEGLRCDGGSHGGCQAGCMLFWKEAWLRRSPPLTSTLEAGGEISSTKQDGASCSEETLLKATRAFDPAQPDSVKYVCQATQLWKATSAVSWWDVRHYYWDLKSGNRTVDEIVRALLMWIFNKVQAWRGGCQHPFYRGYLKRTPKIELNLQPGDWVEVRTKKEIQETLDVRGRNLGLSFDAECVEFCGGRYQVRSRVAKIINEKTGHMMELPNESVILEGVACRGLYHQLCPRSGFPFWREIWLNRVESVHSQEQP